MINDVGILNNGWRNIKNSEASCYNGISKKACKFRLNNLDMHSRDILKALGCKITTQCHIQTTQNGTFKFVVVSFTPFHSITSLHSSVLFHASATFHTSALLHASAPFYASTPFHASSPFHAMC